ncbi:MAG: hypothetical protein ABSG55_00830 [Dehalococcoidia bacterium]|jgi:hypothetical protein
MTRTVLEDAAYRVRSAEDELANLEAAGASETEIAVGAERLAEAKRYLETREDDERAKGSER